MIMVRRLVFTSHNITIPFSWESLLISDIFGLEFIVVPF